MSSWPHIYVFRSAAQAVANNVYTVAEDVSWATAAQANAAMWTAGTAFRMPMNGIYFMASYIQWVGAAAGGVDFLGIVVNGGEIMRSFTANGPYGAATLVAATYRCKANDLVTFRAYQTSGAPQNYNNGAAVISLVGGA
jgi:hypothetical protein